MAKRFNLTSVALTAKTEEGVEINIGSAEEATFTANTSNKPAHQANSKMPVENVDGIITVAGSIKRATVDWDNFKLLNKTGENPIFTITAVERISNRVMSVTGCKIKGDLAVNMTLSDYVTDTIEFDALDYDFA